MSNRRLRAPMSLAEQRALLVAFALSLVVVLCAFGRSANPFGVAADRLRSPVRLVLGTYPVSDGSNFVVWAENGPTSGEWLGRFDADGHRTWAHALLGASDAVGEYHRIAADSARVFIRYVQASDDSIHVLAMTVDGGVLWDHQVARCRSEGPEPCSEDLSASRVLEPAQATLFVSGDGQSIVMLDVHTGVERGREEGTAHGEVAVHGRWLIMQSSPTVALGAGVMPRILDGSKGCVIGDRYFYVVGHDDRAVLVGLDANDLSTVRIQQPLPGRSSVRQCGAYHGNLVLIVDPDDAHETHLLIFDDHLAIRHDVPLAGAAGFDLASDSALPRFVPYRTHPSGERHERLVMVDLELGRIAWESARELDVGHEDPVRFGTSWLWFQDRDRRVRVTVFDGTTGEVADAFDASAPDGVIDLDRAKTNDDTLSMFDHAWTDGEALSFARYDVAARKPRFARGITITDRTAKAHAMWGH